MYQTVRAELCEEIAEFRRWCHRLGKQHVLFLDETAVNLNIAPINTLVAEGETPYVIVEEDTSYAARMDMIALISSKRKYPPIIFTPEDRAVEGVQGIRTDMLVHGIEDLLAQAVGEEDIYPVFIILDKCSIHNKGKMLEAFHFHGGQNLVDIKYLPTQSAKRLSPLDNTLFHTWKERVRNHHPITGSTIVSIMSQEWENLPDEQLVKYYRHCKLMRGQNVYKDCPVPHLHHHSTSTSSSE